MCYGIQNFNHFRNKVCSQMDFLSDFLLQKDCDNKFENETDLKNHVLVDQKHLSYLAILSTLSSFNINLFIEVANSICATNKLLETLGLNFMPVNVGKRGGGLLARRSPACQLEVDNCAPISVYDHQRAVRAGGAAQSLCRAAHAAIHAVSRTGLRNNLNLIYTLNTIILYRDK